MRKGVSATFQSGKYTLSYARGRYNGAHKVNKHMQIYLYTNDIPRMADRRTYLEHYINVEGYDTCGILKMSN